MSPHVAIVSGTDLPTHIIMYVKSACPHDDNVFIGKLVFTPLATRLMLCQFIFFTSVSGEGLLQPFFSHNTYVFINSHS